MNRLFGGMVILKPQLPDDPCHAGVAVKGPEDEADVHADAFVVVRGVEHVACQGLLVAVEGQAYEFSSGVHDRTAGVSSRDVVVSEEVHIHVRSRARSAVGVESPSAPVRLPVQEILAVAQSEVVV